MYKIKTSLKRILKLYYLSMVDYLQFIKDNMVKMKLILHFVADNY